MEGTAPPILGRDILPDSRLDRRLSRAFSTCAPLHLHCLIFFPDSVRVIPLVSTVMVTPPPWNGPPVSFALSWARLPSVRSVALRSYLWKSNETIERDDGVKTREG